MPRRKSSGGKRSASIGGTTQSAFAQLVANQSAPQPTKDKTKAEQEEKPPAEKDEKPAKE